MKQAYFIALGLVGNHEDALDLSQEAFFRAYSKINQLNPKRKFFPWFYQILKNLCFSHLRKRSGRPQQNLEEVDEVQVASSAGSRFDPHAVAERNEAEERVWKAIEHLSEKHREMIVLRHFQDLSYEEIAQILLCTRGTVMSRLYNARKKLKELLDK